LQGKIDAVRLIKIYSSDLGNQNGLVHSSLKMWMYLTTAYFIMENERKGYRDKSRIIPAHYNEQWWAFVVSNETAEIISYTIEL